MAKRGRPSKKVVRKRKDMKAKSRLYIALAILLLILLAYFGYYTLMK